MVAGPPQLKRMTPPRGQGVGQGRLRAAGRRAGADHRSGRASVWIEGCSTDRFRTRAAAATERANSNEQKLSDQ